MALCRFLRLALVVFGALTWASMLAANDAPEALIKKLHLSSGWTSSEPPRVAVGNELFELIDGGAELYHEFGFKRAASQSIGIPSGGNIQIELYEMSDAAAAYGVWSLMQAGDFARGDLGQGSLRFRYYVALWSGSYFASVTGAQLDRDTQQEVDRLAVQLASLLPLDGHLPEWFGRLPSADLKEKMYVRGKIGLSNTPHGSTGAVVDSKEALLGSYSDHQTCLYVFGSEQEARAKLESVLQHGSKNEVMKSVDRTPDGLTGRFVDEGRFEVRRDGASLLVTRWPASGF